MVPDISRPRLNGNGSCQVTFLQRHRDNFRFCRNNVTSTSPPRPCFSLHLWPMPHKSSQSYPGSDFFEPYPRMTLKNTAERRTRTMEQ